MVKSTIRGPCTIGKNCIIENSFIGPCTSVKNNETIKNSSVEYSIIQKNATINNIDRLEESLIGEYATLTKDQGNRGTLRLRVGDYSAIEL